MTRPLLNRRYASFGSTIFGVMSARALATGSVNLGQGFPDVDGPAVIAETAAEAVLTGKGNQYPPATGIPELRAAVARHQRRFYGLDYDPDSEVLITAGATEAIAAAILALCEPGDEVIAFEPYYDSYVANITMAGATRVPLTLRPPHFRPDLDELASKITGKTRLLLLNSPHNPTGMVLTREETEAIARMVIEHDLLVVADEAYEHLTFDVPHVPFATVDGMRGRVVSIGSAGKSFSFTGWKIGWVTGAPDLVAAVRTTKQFLTYVNGGPFQYAVARALDLPDSYYTEMATDLKAKRDLMASGLADIGFEVYQPDGTYFITTDIAPLGGTDGMEFCLGLPDRAGVVAIPSAVFYDDHPEAGRTQVRFAFCKRQEVLKEALSRLSVLARLSRQNPSHGTGSADSIPQTVGLDPWPAPRGAGTMDHMTTPGSFAAAYGARLRANWPALLLPLVAADTRGLFGDPARVLLVIVAVALAVRAPRQSARLTPYAFLAYGAYGLYLYHALGLYESPFAVYGIVRSGPGDNAGYVLAQSIVFLTAGTWLLAVSGAPGSRAVHRAVAQVRGTGGEPKTVPPLLLLPVLFLWEELFSNQLWFAASAWGRVIALLFATAGIALVVRLPRQAAALAVAGLVLFGLYGVLDGGWHTLNASPDWLAGDNNYGRWLWGWTYGAVPLNTAFGGPAALIQGAVLFGAGYALTPRLLTWSGDLELARRAQQLTQRVARLTQTRNDATEVAVAELRRIERDLHDGAQARLVAVGMSLRAAEQLMHTSPEAALALVAEARATSSRALDDLRDLVRGIYPPVLADRGLADAVRALALDAPVTVETDIALTGEPPMPVAAAVYFGIAEALTNAVRHAEACLVEISIEHTGGVLRTTVTDDGQGGADPSRGTGLAGVERRLATFDGIVAVSSPAGGPTIVVIEVPCALSGGRGAARLTQSA